MNKDEYQAIIDMHKEAYQMLKEAFDITKEVARGLLEENKRLKQPNIVYPTAPIYPAYPSKPGYYYFSDKTTSLES